MSGYIGPAPVPQATQTRQTFTATSGQTSFATVGYVAGGQFIQVYLNGVLLKLTDDYTAENGSDILLTSGAATGDILEFISFADFTVNNQNFTGGLTVDADGATVLTVDRATSDGTIIDVQKDGSSVGNIGTNNGDLTIGTGDVRLRFNDANDEITPRNSDNSGRTDAVDLGTGTIRFKDLYLSGGVVFDAVSGSATSNTLDDYEEGTWTPATGTGTLTVNSGAYYTKVGRNVTLHINDASFSNITATSALAINGIPFAPSGSSAVGLTMMQHRDDTITIAAYIPATVSQIRFYQSSTTAGYTSVPHNIFSSTNNSIYLSITYQTA